MNDRYREECSVSVEVKISEKFYLEEGRGVEELQELSIEDVLNWEDYHSFIQTKGHLYVKGYYLHEDGHYDQSEKLHYPERKYLDHIEEINEAESLFTQTIPIDVTIPKDKVKDFDDLNITVSDYGYEMPTPHLFILFITLHIAGVNEEKAEDDERVQEDQLEDEKQEEKEDLQEEIIVENEEDEPIEDDLDQSDEESYFLNELFSSEEAYCKIHLYIVQEDDTLAEIGKKYDVLPTKILQDNDHVTGTISPGMLLRIYK